MTNGILCSYWLTCSLLNEYMVVYSHGPRMSAKLGLSRQFVEFSEELLV